MIGLQDTIQSVIPLVLTFVLVLTYQSIISTVLSGVFAFGVTVALSIATWYLVCRIAFDGDGRFSIGNRPS